MTATPRPRDSRHTGMPAYYQGRPASWITTSGRRRPAAPRRLVAAGSARHADSLPAAGGGVVDPRVTSQQAIGAGLVVHRADPLNAETPLRLLAGAAVVVSDRFYVRNHFGIPDLDTASWRLRVGGLAVRPLSLSLAQLRSMPSQTVVATLECAGNGRSVLDPPVPGEQWGLGAVGTAAWTGVLLTEVLGAAAPLPGAREAVFRGADRGPVDGRDYPVAFERSLPLGGRGPTEALLAYAMNGAPLPAAHGYPLRLIVPGWYGVASVKWLTGIELTGEPFDGYFQADRYHIGGQPVTLQAVRSLITAPRPGNIVEPGEVTVRGLAWSGAAPIARVEVSIAGQTWQAATRTGDLHPHGWQSWHLKARLEEPGRVTIRSRATDTAGRTQPDRPSWNRFGYAANPVHRVVISVQPPSPHQRSGAISPPRQSYPWKDST